jgi:hypothetical protein
VESWSETKSLILVIAVITLFYILGRWVAESLANLSASGALPSF